MAAEGRIRENLYQQMENLNKFAKFYTNKIKPLYGIHVTGIDGWMYSMSCHYEDLYNSHKACLGSTVILHIGATSKIHIKSNFDLNH